jgi:hypothetical protein
VIAATRSYVGEVKSGAFPGEAHSFGMGKAHSTGEPTGAQPVVASEPPAYGPTED